MGKKNSGGENKNPLVSVCTTFFNAERYIYRLLESCLNQTYKNIEVVVVDDESTDNSEMVLREYAARDSRISYYRNSKRVGLAESELQMFRSAKGDFAMMMGADDWLAKDYIEKAIKTFLGHPDAAGVVPKLISLVEKEDGTFRFLNNALDKFIPPKTYSTKWFIENTYKPKGLFISALALVRTKDWVSAMDYYVENFYYNPPESAPDDLRRLFKMAWAIDVVMFLKILTRYKNFVFDSSLSYIKISLSGGQANNLDFKRNLLSEIFKESYYQFFINAYVYKFIWRKFYRGMKIFCGAQMLSTALIYFLRYIFSPNFLNFRESKKYINIFFNDFSFFEVVVAVICFVLMFIRRFFGFVKRKVFKKDNGAVENSLIFVRENFLGSDRRFIAKNE